LFLWASAACGRRQGANLWTVFYLKPTFLLFGLFSRFFLGAPLALTRIGSGYRLYASRWRARIPALSLAHGLTPALNISLIYKLLAEKLKLQKKAKEKVFTD
jgi:hypothetical protein